MELCDKLKHLAVPINIPLVSQNVTSDQPSVCDNPAYLAEELISHALNRNDTTLSSPELMEMTDRLLATPRAPSFHHDQTPKPPPRNNKRKDALSPLFNDTKRSSTPRINTIFHSDSNNSRL